MLSKTWQDRIEEEAYGRNTSEWNKCKGDAKYFFKNYIFSNTKDDGIVRIKPHPHQLTMFKKFEEGNSIVILPRQCGKSVATAAYALWLILFKDNFNITMASNKLDMAKFTMYTVLDMYKKLPHWITSSNPTTKEYGNLIELSNKSKIKFTSFGNVPGIHGDPIDVLILDELAYGIDEIIRGYMDRISYCVKDKILIVSSVGNKFLEGKVKGRKRRKHIFFELYRKAVTKKIPYSLFKRSYKQLSTYDESWENNIRKMLGKDHYEKEFLCKFSKN